MTRDLNDIEKEFEKMKRQMDYLMSGFVGDSFDGTPLISSSDEKNFSFSF